MGRLKLKLPEKFNFQTLIKIRISDINYGGHVGNDSILSMIHEARIQYINSLDYQDELNIEGFGLIMSDVAIVYKSEAFYGSKIKIEVGVDDIARVSFDLCYRLSCNDNNVTVAIAKTGIIFYNYEEKKAVSIPEKFLNKIK